MPLTLTLPRPPSQNGYAIQTEYRIAESIFGDGYSQRVADGINTVRKVVTVPLEFLTTAEYQTIVDFMDARAGWEAFYYTLEGENSPRLWTCRTGVQASPVSGNLWNVNFTLREEFDLA